MISAALDDSVRKLRSMFRKEQVKRTMMQKKINDIIESMNSVVEYLDGQSINKQRTDALVKFTFIGKKLDFLELDFLDEEGED